MKKIDVGVIALCLLIAGGALRDGIVSARNKQAAFQRVWGTSATSFTGGQVNDKLSSLKARIESLETEQSKLGDKFPQAGGDCAKQLSEEQVGELKASWRHIDEELTVAKNELYRYTNTAGAVGFSEAYLYGYSGSGDGFL